MAFSEESSDDEERTTTATQRGRRNIRDIKNFEDLTLATKLAIRNEKERMARLERQEQKLKEVLSRRRREDELILYYDFEEDVPLVQVDPYLVQKMKDHQKEGVKFMWNACFESPEQIECSEGSGCILAHCMGLGKSLQVVALAHTLLKCELARVKRILICCPKNTLFNWEDEFAKWISDGDIRTYNLAKFESHSHRLAEVESWYRDGGVAMINYELMRSLVEERGMCGGKYHWFLCSPGPEVVVCDEGHVLKNEETKLSKAMGEIRTMRRIVLTGTPMQNNLREYHCMVQFVKPNLLGTRQEFVNMFVNPILNGQYENSRVEDVQVMKERSHILHKTLSGCVQRYDLGILKWYLPMKREYVISLALTEKQIRMYRFYLENYSGRPDWKYNSFRLFADYQFLQRIWTHPYLVRLYEEDINANIEKKRKTQRKNGRKTESDSTDLDDLNRERVPRFWWTAYCSSDDMEDPHESTKLRALFHVISDCEQTGQKLLVFSGSLYSLRLIQHFLKRVHQCTFRDPSLCNLSSPWAEGEDYLVLTGQTSSEDRESYCRSFNDPYDTRLRLFLISTKAGGMGLNLTAANRAVLFDVSWNPSHDIQSIFRIYRIGQERPCYVYRFLASGTMEEKIYERQVAKQSIGFRVIDEKQIARHFTERQLQELYEFKPKKERERLKEGPQERVVKRLLSEMGDCVVGVHEHETLLEHREEEELQEQEKNFVWSAYSGLDDGENLPSRERAMLAQLKPESFDEHYLRLALEKRFPKARSAEISLAMKALLPKVKRILKQPNFLEAMKQQALYRHLSKKSRTAGGERRVGRGSAQKKKTRKRRRREATIDLTQTPGGSRPSTSRRQSGSDDSMFLYEITGKRRKVTGKKKPVKMWGVRGNKPFGSPEEDSS